MQFLEARALAGTPNPPSTADKTQAFYNDLCRDRWYGPKICGLMFSLIKGHRHLGTFKRLTLRRRLSILRRGVFRHKRVCFLDCPQRHRPKAGFSGLTSVPTGSCQFGIPCATSGPSFIGLIMVFMPPTLCLQLLAVHTFSHKANSP